MEKRESNRLDKKEEIAEEKSLKKRVVIIAIVLFILFLLSVSLFFGRYFFLKNKIKSMFGGVQEVDKETEFDSGSFASLKSACVGKEIGDDCEIYSNGVTKDGVCSLSANNESVCVFSS